jgi:acyl-CoA thioester hydrolase
VLLASTLHRLPIPDFPIPDSRFPMFEQTLRVQLDDLDDLAHVNNVVYLRWVQDIATAHWFAMAPDDARETVAWVARRHEIDYLAPAVLGDDIVLRTWVGEAQGLTFERFTEIRRTDGHVLARARTLWVPVDRATGRPRRVSAEVRALFGRAAGMDAGNP